MPVLVTQEHPSCHHDAMMPVFVLPERKTKIARMGEASPALRVSEDKTQIGRAVAMTEADGEERLGRTVQVRYGNMVRGTRYGDVIRYIQQQ